MPDTNEALPYTMKSAPRGLPALAVRFTTGALILSVSVPPKPPSVTSLVLFGAITPPPIGSPSAREGALKLALFTN
ncbi:MAG: hypothetical protein ACK5Z4_15035 [Planctomyces sp.]